MLSSSSPISLSPSSKHKSNIHYNSSTSIRNPFKPEQGVWTRYAGFLIAAFLITLSFLALTEQGKSEARQLHEHARHFHEHHIAKNWHRLKHHLHSKKHEELGHHPSKTHEEVAEHGKLELKEHEDHHHNDHHLHKTKLEKVDQFPKISMKEFPEWIHQYNRNLKWTFGQNLKSKNLSHDILLESLELGCQSMIDDQTDEGNFKLQSDLHNEDDDAQSQQAATLWSVALCFQQLPHRKDLQEATEKGIGFFMKHAETYHTDEEEFYVVIKYPGQSHSFTGTNALVALAIIDYFRTIQDNHFTVSSEFTDELAEQLEGLLEFVLWQQLEDHRFSSSYDIETDNTEDIPNPAYDGEALLCLVKAAKYMNWQKYRLLPFIEAAAPALAKIYTIDAWHHDKHDSDATKAFYPAGALALEEYFDANWKDAKVVGDCVLVLAHWMIHTHHILHHTHSTSYEGLIAAYQVALAHPQTEAGPALMASIDEGLRKHATWQIGGPLSRENPLLRKISSHEQTLAKGMIWHDESSFRMETTRHQMQATILALNHLYFKNEREEDHRHKK